MRRAIWGFEFRSLHCLVAVITALISQAFEAASVAVPSSDCYVFDNSSRIVDFGSDLVIRFCKDVESRSQKGYVDFGRFDKFNYFVTGSGQVDFVQGFYNGDLNNCELSHDKMGRTAQVNMEVTIGDGLYSNESVIM